jgi:hypothetical protein
MESGVYTSCAAFKMKQIIYIILTFSILTSCQTKNSEQTDTINSEQVELVEQKAERKKTTNGENYKSVFIKDSSDYSNSFLKEMEKQGMNNISLVDSFLILGQTDTVTFPQTPKIGTKTILTAKKGELAIALTVNRINQTTIDYKIEMVEFGNASYNYEGQADLNPRFYFGAETDESSLSGISYLSTQFSDSQDSCYTYIRLGKEEDSGPYLLGKLIKNCNGKLRNIDLEDFPTLVEK